MSEAQIQQVHLRARLLDRRRRSPASPAAASAWTWCATTSTRSAAPSTCKSVPGEGTELHHQDPADARHRLGADRRGRRRALRHPAALGGRAGARARQVRAPHRAHQGRAGAAAAQQAAAAGPPRAAAEARSATTGDAGERLHRRDAGRQRRPSASWSTACSTPRKSWSSRCRRKLRHIGMFSGNTILGDGSVIMIIDPNGVVAGGRRVGALDAGGAGRQPKPSARGSRQTTCRCWCSAPARRSPRRCRSRWSPGWKRSTARRSSSPTAATWCSTAAS